MATTNSQRFGIWVIAIVLTVGTIAGFVAMIIAPQNDAADQANAQEEYLAALRKQQEEAKKANRPLDGYKASEFNPDSVKTLKVEVLKEGDGKEAKATSTVTANYFGWDQSGEIFDSTNKDGTVTPIDFSLEQVIEGWTKGLTGVKQGSVVRLSIPAEQAYGSEDNGSGQPVGPLKFVVELKKVQ